MTRLSDALLKDIIRHVEPAHPDEACGLILQDPDGLLRVQPADNLANRYHALDPVAWPRTARTFYMINTLEIARAERRGERLRAIFHSHCDVGDYFSDEDHLQAVGQDGLPLWPGCDYLVVSVRAGAADRATAFRFNGDSGRFDAAEVYDLTALR